MLNSFFSRAVRLVNGPCPLPHTHTSFQPVCAKTCVWNDNKEILNLDGAGAGAVSVSCLQVNGHNETHLAQVYITQSSTCSVVHASVFLSYLFLHCHTFPLQTSQIHLSRLFLMILLWMNLSCWPTSCSESTSFLYCFQSHTQTDPLVHCWTCLHLLQLPTSESFTPWFPLENRGMIIQSWIMVIFYICVQLSPHWHHVTQSTTVLSVLYLGWC